jgi:hypothetical protein
MRELIVDVDDKTCRHSWSARGKPLTHHNASVQVFADGERPRKQPLQHGPDRPGRLGRRDDQLGAQKRGADQPDGTVLLIVQDVGPGDVIVSADSPAVPMRPRV